MGWPLIYRERNAQGRPGKLHAKCAIIDDSALISSANLTEDAFNRNIELGVIVRDRGAAEELLSHFSELMRRGVLVEARKNSSGCD